MHPHKKSMHVLPKTTSRFRSNILLSPGVQKKYPEELKKSSEFLCRKNNYGIAELA